MLIRYEADNGNAKFETMSFDTTQLLSSKYKLSFFEPIQELMVTNSIHNTKMLISLQFRECQKQSAIDTITSEEVLIHQYVKSRPSQKI